MALYPFKKILAIKLRSLGDTVLMTAPISELHRAFPGAKIDVAVLTPWAPLLENIPGVSRIWAYDKHPHRAARAKSAIRMAYRLRQERYDCVVNFHASPSSAMIAFATGAKTRSIHFHGHRDKNRYSTVVVPGKGTLKPIIERDMDTIRALGVEVAPGLLPRVYPTAGEAQKAREYVGAVAEGGPVMALGIGASRSTKGWPIESFARLAVEWSEKQNGAAIALTGAHEKTLAQNFLKRIDEILSLIIADQAKRSKIRGRISCESHFSVRELSAFLGAASVFVGNDSGPKHLAVANQTPTVTLFGPEHPFEWHPYPTSEHPYFFIENLACRKDAQPGMPPWCGVGICDMTTDEQHRCMRGIGTEQVLARCIELFSRGRTS